MPPVRKPHRPRKQALAWWKSHVVKDEYVLAAAAVPSVAVGSFLRHEKLMHVVAGKRVVILKTPETLDDRALFLANYWRVVARVLAAYEPAAVTGIDAVRLHMGDFKVPHNLHAIHAASRSKYLLGLDAEFTLNLVPRGGSKAAMRRTVTMVDAPGASTIPVLTPAALLVTLDEPEIQRDVDTVAAWLRHLVLQQPDLDAVLGDSPRPVILGRLADMAETVGNRGLQRQLDRAAQQHSAKRSTPKATGVGTRIVVSSALQDLDPGEGTPWGDAQRVRMARQVAEVDAVWAESGTLPPSFNRRDLLAHARAAKAFDAYHSTTLEGYRIARDVSDAIVAGRKPPRDPASEEERRAAMAVQGYSYAFDAVLALAGSKAPITRNLILDLYEELFRPSVDAGVVKPHELRGWRNDNVSLQGYRHIPPAHPKLRDLLIGLERFAESAVAPLTRAAVVHLEFVTIHPFFDGNGRLGRLLLNLELLRAGFPWVTVRADERRAFFSAIERAQVDDDTGDYAALIEQLVRAAAKDLTARLRDRVKR